MQGRSQTALRLCMVLFLCVPLLSHAAGLNYEQQYVDWALGLHQREVEPDPDDKQIEEILIAREDVISKADVWPNLFNIFHMKTREDVVRREVLLSPGDIWNSTLAAETERNLRRLFIFAVARVVPVKGKNGGIALLVVTKDRWSLRFNSAYSLIGSTLQYLQLRPTEQNFLGRNQQLQLEVTRRLDTMTLGELWRNPRVWGTSLVLEESAYMKVNRQTAKAEGSFGGVLLGSPLRNLSQKWGWAAIGNWNIQPRRIYRGTSVWQLPYPDDQTPGAATIQYVYGQRSAGVQALATRSMGVTHKTDLTMALGAYKNTFTIPIALALSEEEKTWMQQKYLPHDETATYAAFQAQYFEDNYRVFKNIDTYQLSEDVQLGPNAAVGLRYAFPSFSGTTHFLEFGATVGEQFLLWDSDLLDVQFAAAARSTFEGIPVDRRYAFEVSNVSPMLFGGRLVARFTGDFSQASINNRQVLLGGANGLRGLPPDALAGRNYVLGNVEYRTRSFEVQSLYLGMVLFYDVGGAFDDVMAVTHTAGLGLRLLIPQFNQELIRIDLGLVTSSNYKFGLDRFSSSFGQVTGYRSSLLSSPLGIGSARF